MIRGLRRLARSRSASACGRSRSSSAERVLRTRTGDPRCRVAPFIAGTHEGGQAMHGSSFARRGIRLAGALVFLSALLAAAGAAAKGSASVAQAAQQAKSPKPKITWDTTHDVSPPLRVLAANRVAPDAEDPADEPDLGPRPGADTGYSGDGALQSALLPAAIPSTSAELRGAEQQGQLQHLRIPREPAGPGRRRRARTTTSRWSTSSSPSTQDRAHCCSGRSTPARSGRTSR